MKIKEEYYNPKELELQDPVTIDLTCGHYSDQMIEKYGNSVKVKLKYMAGWYPGCFPGEIFYEGIICKDGENIYIPSRECIKENIICEDKEHKQQIKFKYNNIKYNGYLDHIDNDVYYIIGEDNLFYKIKKENII